MASAGNQMSQNSEMSTLSPLAERKRDTPIGETSIGVSGRKYRSALKGQKNAIPRPPSVIASSTPWEQAPIKTKRKVTHLSAASLL